MSQFYRCDGCGAEAEHPGVDYDYEVTHLPAGWKTGPEGDYCPKHPMRVADGQFIFILMSPGWSNTGEEPAKVKGYNPSKERYTLTVLPDGEEEFRTITRSRSVVEKGAARLMGGGEWVPIRTCEP